MTVKLMLTCLCDAFYGEVGIATVKVLERAGCTVEFPVEQTCCGQPPFNSGDWTAARAIVRQWQNAFEVNGSEPSVPIVSPSSSCAAMIREGYSQLLGGTQEHKVWELSEFLVHGLGLRTWPPEADGRSILPRRTIAYHRACHGRAIHLGSEQEMLLRSIPGVVLVPIGQPEQCCGFGGAFSVGHPTVSAGIGLEKLRHVVESGAAELVSGDMGCLMHLDGLIRKHELPLETRHFAEVLAEEIDSAVTA